MSAWQRPIVSQVSQPPLNRDGRSTGLASRGGPGGCSWPASYLMCLALRVVKPAEQNRSVLVTHIG